MKVWGAYLSLQQELCMDDTKQPHNVIRYRNIQTFWSTINLFGTNLLWHTTGNQTTIPRQITAHPPPTLPPSALDHKPSSAKKECRKTTCRTGTQTSVKKPKSTPAPKKRAHTLSENCSELYGISDTAEPAVTSRSRHRSRRDIDYLTLNDGLEEDSVESPKRRKKPHIRQTGEDLQWVA